MVKEFNDHTKRNHWKLLPTKEVTTGTKKLDAILSIELKRDILSGRVMKWKSKMTVHRGQQGHGVNYTETYAHMTSCYTIQTLLTLALINKWYTRTVYCLLAYPKAPIEYDIFVLPTVLRIKGVN